MLWAPSEVSATMNCLCKWGSDGLPPIQNEICLFSDLMLVSINQLHFNFSYAMKKVLH